MAILLEGRVVGAPVIEARIIGGKVRVTLGEGAADGPAMRDAKELVEKTSFVNFTSTGLRAKTKLGTGTGDEHPFFELAERLLGRAREFAPAKAS